MKTQKNIFYKIYKWENILLAFKKARKGKTKKRYVKYFEENLIENLQDLQFELMTFTYKPKPLETFILRDPKTRKISKSDFRDRIIHHAIVNVLEPIFEKTFIYDSCANQIGKGNLLAIKRFEKFQRKISRNGKLKGWFNKNQIKGYVLKADIKHYFQEVDHQVLLQIFCKKIKDEKTIWLIEQVLCPRERETARECTKSMPLGNLTSQFFANIYLNELDYFVKHELKAKYYIRYVDDFLILHSSKEQLKFWKRQIQKFLSSKLKLELHPQKSKILSLSKGIDFVGFRNFYHFKLLRKRNIRIMMKKINNHNDGLILKNKMIQIFQGWNAYAKWANTYKLRRQVLSKINMSIIAELFDT